MGAPDLFSRLYDPVMERPESLGLQRLREDALRGLARWVLELGIGTGRNLPLYPPTVERLWGIDPDETMLARAEDRVRETALPVDLIPAPAEELPFEDASFDAAVATLVFCTVPDPLKSLREVRRVLKRDGVAFWST